MFYPKLDEITVKNLAVIRRLASEHPNYFTDDDCPYPDSVAELLRITATQAPIINKDRAEALDVITEITETYRGLKDHKPDIQDTSAMMGYYRTATSLLDKLLEQMERGKNQKEISQFYSTILEILEEIATPTQREVFRERLAGFNQ